MAEKIIEKELVEEVKDYSKEFQRIHWKAIVKWDFVEIVKDEETPIIDIHSRVSLLKQIIADAQAQIDRNSAIMEEAEKELVEIQEVISNK